MDTLPAKTSLTHFDRFTEIANTLWRLKCDGGSLDQARPLLKTMLELAKDFRALGGGSAAFMTVVYTNPAGQWPAVGLEQRGVTLLRKNLRDRSLLDRIDLLKEAHYGKHGQLLRTAIVELLVEAVAQVRSLPEKRDLMRLAYEYSETGTPQHEATSSWLEANGDAGDLKTLLANKTLPAGLTPALV